MSKYSLRYNYRDIVSKSSKSPLPFMSRTDSPVTSVVLQHKKQYKSPDSTPASSPMPKKEVSCEEVFQCFTEKQNKGQSIYLLQKISIQDKRIKLLEEENKRLASCRKPENWEKELLRRNGDMRKLEDQVKYYMELNAENRDAEKLNETIREKNEIIQELQEKLKSAEEKNCELKEKYRKVVEENEKIKAGQKQLLKKNDFEVLLAQIQELELALEYHDKVNKELKEENERMKKEISPGTLNYFAVDINKIRVEMNKLANIVDDFAKGKEITLKGLLGFDSGIKLEPAKQFSNDIASIKSDLSRVLTTVSDFHAEQFASMACRTQ